LIGFCITPRSASPSLIPNSTGRLQRYHSLPPFLILNSAACFYDVIGKIDQETHPGIRVCLCDIHCPAHIRKRAIPPLVDWNAIELLERVAQDADSLSFVCGDELSQPRSCLLEYTDQPCSQLRKY